MATVEPMSSEDCILRLPEVEKLAGLRRSTLYRYMADGQFPASVRLGVRHVGWRRADVLAWTNSLAFRESLVHASAAPDASRDLGIAGRIRRSEGRESRCHNANARLTRKELEGLKVVAAAQGKALGEWTREVLLNEATRANTDRALFTELTALRLLMTNVLRPLALGETLTPEDFQAITAGVRNDKHDAAQQLLAQYQPIRIEGQ